MTIGRGSSAHYKRRPTLTQNEQPPSPLTGEGLANIKKGVEYLAQYLHHDNFIWEGFGIEINVRSLLATIDQAQERVRVLAGLLRDANDDWLAHYSTENDLEADELALFRGYVGEALANTTPPPSEASQPD